MASRLLPQNVQQIGLELAIAWNDGTESFLPLEELRRACPCAVCGGEPDVLGYLARPDVTYTPESFELRGWQLIGGYALQPSWADGHGSGLYTFGLLRRIAEAAAPVNTPPRPRFRRMSKRTQIFSLGFLFLICLSAALVQTWQQHERDAMRPAELFNVVWRQIAAFRADDYASAYQQVSTGFQEKFTITSFTDLARSEYPLLSRADRVEFGPVHWDGRHAIIPVYFFLPDGEVIPCLYSLIQEDEDWKIDALKVQKRWPAGRRLGGMRA